MKKPLDRSPFNRQPLPHLPIKLLSFPFPPSYYYARSNGFFHHLALPFHLKSVHPPIFYLSFFLTFPNYELYATESGVNQVHIFENINFAHRSSVIACNLHSFMSNPFKEVPVWGSNGKIFNLNSVQPGFTIISLNRH